jgi:hypothetical protein
MNRSALTYFAVALGAVLVALLLAPLVPDPGGHIVSVIAWVVAAVAAILGVVALVRSGV